MLIQTGWWFIFAAVQHSIVQTYDDLFSVSVNRQGQVIAKDEGSEYDCRKAQHLPSFSLSHTQNPTGRGVALRLLLETGFN